MMKQLFRFKTNRDDGRSFVIPNVNTEYMGKLSLRYFGPLVWETMLPEKFKGITVLESFKEEIKTWVPRNCPCRLCKTFIVSVGFVDTFE